MRRARFAVWGVAGVVGLGIVWVVVTALLARRQLSQVQDRLADVRLSVAQGRIAHAQELAAAIPSMTDHAHDLTSGPAWFLGSHVPYLGKPLQVARGTTAAARELGNRAIPELITVSRDVNPSSLLVNGRTVRLAPLAAAVPSLVAADRSLSTAASSLTDLPTHTWLNSVDHGRAGLVEQVSSLRGYVQAATRAARVIPTMLGSDGRTRHYFIGLQNEAEMRGTGGLPGAFAIASTRNGTITFDRFESDTILLPAATNQLIDTGLDFGKSYNGLYGASNPTQQYVDSNSSPNFPYAAKIWAAMWEKQSHQHIDGAIAVDPTALSYFLAATGPAIVPGTNGSISAANVVSLTQRDEYTLFPDNNARKKFLVAVLKAAANKLTSGVGSPVLLVQAASRSASERRLLIWSSDASAQKSLEETTYAGDISGKTTPLSALILNNAAAGKLDYYLKRSVDYSRTGCGSRRDVNVTITLDNTAPASGLPPYVTDRLDANPPKTARPGDSRSIVDYYATGGAVLQSVTVNGTRTAASSTDTLGRTVFRLNLELPRDVPQTIQLHLNEPAGAGAPVIWAQPGVIPQTTTVFNQICG